MKSGGGKKFNSEDGRYTHFYNTIVEAHRLYPQDSKKWDKFFPEYAYLNDVNEISSVEHALAERNKIIKSFNLKRKIPKNSAYAFQLFLGASEALAPDWRTNEASKQIWKDYFATCEKWARKYFPGIVLSVTSHFDEATPHCHINIIPILKNQPIFHNEPILDENGEPKLNEKGKPKVRRVMTCDEKGNPILVTKYTSGSFLSPAGCIQLQTDFANAVKHFGVERGTMNSQAEHDDLRASTRIHARKQAAEVKRLEALSNELEQERLSLEKRNKNLEERTALIKNLLAVPMKKFKLQLQPRKLMPGLYEWEYKGTKCKNFDDFREKEIEDQTTQYVYRADLRVQKLEEKVAHISESLSQEKEKNEKLSRTISKLEYLVLHGTDHELKVIREKMEPRIRSKTLQTPGNLNRDTSDFER